MQESTRLTPAAASRDLMAGVIVFLVALPLCLGIALASGAPLFSGLVAGIVGGIVVGVLSGSHTSVSGPAAGLTAVVLAQIAALGSFEAFLLAVMIGGILQIGLGLARAGALSAFFPSSVIKGLLAAIGVILILKQFPHIFGHDSDPQGDMAFRQADSETTFSELGQLLGNIHPGATVIGLLSIAVLVFWDRFKPLKNSLVPAPLVVVLAGVAIGMYFERLGGAWAIQASHLVQVPVAESVAGFFDFLKMPDFSQWNNPAIYIAAVTIAIVASLETLLNLEAVDKLDRKQRHSPPSRELLAQGVGNTLSGLIGGLPITSVVIRGSVNVNAGAQSKLSAIFHGCLLLFCVMLLPTYLNLIPLSSLAAILLLTGIKLASPALFRQMWSAGRYQFLPFIITLVAIVLTDLLIGILIGLGVAIVFILASNLRRPIRQIVEKHVGGEVLHVELANQVSFLNRAALEKTLRSAERGTHVLLDARRTDYIDPDVLGLIRDFKDVTAPAHGVQVSLRGFRDKYQLHDDICFVDYTTRELQKQLTPAKVLQILKDGNERFRSGRRLDRDLTRHLNGNARAQHPMAVIFSGINSFTPAELIFDLGLGDIYSIRIAGNVTGPKVFGSMEYGCAVAGAKLILVMGHTRSHMMKTAVELACTSHTAEEFTGCQHLEPIINKIQLSVDMARCRKVIHYGSAEEKAAFIDEVARLNVQHSVEQITAQSRTIRRLVEEGSVAVAGAMYDLTTGKIDFLVDEAIGVPLDSRQEPVPV